MYPLHTQLTILKHSSLAPKARKRCQLKGLLLRASSKLIPVLSRPSPWHQSTFQRWWMGTRNRWSVPTKRRRLSLKPCATSSIIPRPSCSQLVRSMIFWKKTTVFWRTASKSWNVYWKKARCAKFVERALMLWASSWRLRRRRLKCTRTRFITRRQSFWSFKKRCSN